MCKGLVWLREQILHGGGPAWLEPEAAAAGQEDLPQQDQAHQEQAPDEGTVKSVLKEYLDFDANKSNWRRRIPCFQIYCQVNMDYMFPITILDILNKFISYLILICEDFQLSFIPSLWNKL